MKKLKVLLISLVLLPINVFAYSDYIIPGGDTLGIEINSDGIMVIGFYEINGKYNKGTPNIKVGDYILEIENEKVSDVNSLTRIVEKNIDKGYVNVLVKSRGKLKNVKLDLIKDDNVYKTGLYVKNSITGIGTLSYIDPSTKIFGALGHEIIDSNTSEIVEIKSGTIFKNYITGIEKSVTGTAGSKNAKFYYNTKYGVILKNTNVGIYGKYDASLPNKEPMKVAKTNEVKIGDAYISTVIEGQKINNFNIEITKIDETAKIKNITFTIKDEELLSKTGGVVQGMSGSPIIQNDKIVGAVTHVIVDNPTTGYGLFITTMLKEGEK
ncbi:stage IV sporulation protein B [bacterium]|nr:stage IV sporulation protein B [bacterium]